MVKFYFDSRARSSGHRHELCTFQLPVSLDLKKEHVAILDSVCIPHTWRTIGPHNDRFFVQEVAIVPPSNTATQRWRVVSIPEGNYSAISLANALATTLNIGTSLVDNYTASYDATLSRIIISNNLSVANTSFAIWGGEYLKQNLAAWNAVSETQVQETRDACREIGFQGDRQVLEASSPGTTITGDSAPNLHQHHNIFIHSSDLGMAGESWGARGQSQIVRKCTITSNPGELSVSQHTTMSDTIKVAPGSYSSLEFSLRSYEGNLIELNGHPWSFSLCLFPVEE